MPDGAGARETAWEPIDPIVITPPKDECDPPGVEDVGEFVALPKAAGLCEASGQNNAQNTNVLRLFARSAKMGSGGQSP